MLSPLTRARASFISFSDHSLARGPRAIARIFFNIRSPLLNSEPHLKRNSDLEIRSFSARLSEPYGLIGCPRKPERPDPIDDDWCSLVTPAFGYWLVKPSLGMLLGGRAKDFHNRSLRESKSQFDSALFPRPRKLLRSWLRWSRLRCYQTSQGRDCIQKAEMRYGVIPQQQVTCENSVGPSLHSLTRI